MPSKKSKKPSLNYRSEFLVDVFKDFIPQPWSILEIGCGDGRNLNFLKEAGYKQVVGIDKAYGNRISIEECPEMKFDVVFSMSALFLIPPENDWVFEKIARMANKYIITVEGETTDYSRNLWGRNYSDVFHRFGFEEVLMQKNVFNEYGVLRVLQRK